MRLFLAVFCLLAATACDEKAATGPTVPITQQFTVAAGEVAVVQDAGVRVQFVRVTGDSRCPADAVCIQGGDAIVHVRVIDSSGTRDHELHTGDASRATASHRDLRLTLVQLQPYPFSSRPVRDEDYRATLQVSR